MTATTPAGTIWLHDVPGGYHDCKCECPRHCLDCFEDLPSTREVRAGMIADGRTPASSALGLRERYCCEWCRNHAKRDRAMGRFLAAQDIGGARRPSPARREFRERTARRSAS